MKSKSKLLPPEANPEKSAAELMAELGRSKRRRERLIKIAIIGALLLITSDRFISNRAERALPISVGSGRSCESLLARAPRLFRHAFMRETECYLKFAKERFVANPQTLSEETMIRLASLFSAEKRMNVDTLFKLIELWIVTHPQRVAKGDTHLDRIRGDFDVAEGLISIMEFFDVESSTMNEQKKLIQWYSGMKKRMGELERESKKVKSSNGLTLLELRIKKMNQRMKAIPQRWKIDPAKAE